MGTQVFGGLGPGLGMTVNPFDPQWVKKQTISQSEQPMIDKENSDAKANYLQKAHDYLSQNISLQASGKPLLVLDPPPYALALDANGQQYTTNQYVTSPLSVIPPVPAGNPTPQNVMPVSATPAADRTDQIIAMLMIMKQDLEMLKAK